MYCCGDEPDGACGREGGERRNDQCSGLERIHFGHDAVERRAHDGMIELPLRLIDLRLRSEILRKLFDRVAMLPPSLRAAPAPAPSTKRACSVLWPA